MTSSTTSELLLAWDRLFLSNPRDRGELTMYAYTEQRDELFTERGTETLLKIRTNVERLLREAGAVRAQEAWKGVGGGSWLMLAALDYLLEKGEIREVTDDTVWAQHRVFVAAT